MFTCIFCRLTNTFIPYKIYEKKYTVTDLSKKHREDYANEKKKRILGKKISRAWALLSSFEARMFICAMTRKLVYIGFNTQSFGNANAASFFLLINRFGAAFEIDADFTFAWSISTCVYSAHLSIGIYAINVSTKISWSKLLFENSINDEKKLYGISNASSNITEYRSIATGASVPSILAAWVLRIVCMEILYRLLRISRDSNRFHNLNTAIARFGKVVRNACSLSLGNQFSVESKRIEALS